MMRFLDVHRIGEWVLMLIEAAHAARNNVTA
jgi:hypothetical protein